MEKLRKEFGDIYDQYIDKIYRFIFLKVNSEDIAKDLTSETFLRGWKAYKKSGNPHPIENIQAFLYQIARNLVIDHYREKGKRDFISVEDVSIIDPGPGIEERAALSSDMGQIKVVLAGLKDDYQNVIIWRYLDELPVSEVAKLLGRTEQATRVLLHRALKSLHQKLNTA